MKDHMDEITLTIDGATVRVPAGASVVEMRYWPWTLGGR